MVVYDAIIAVFGGGMDPLESLLEELESMVVHQRRLLFDGRFDDRFNDRACDPR